MGDLISGFAQWVVEVVYSSGYVGVALLVAAGYLHLLVPTQLVLPLSGFLVGEGRFEFWLVLLWTTAGGVVGSVTLYFPGLWIGEDHIRRIIKRYGKFVFVYEKDLDKASAMFERHGGKAILLGHLVPGVTAFISIPAGIKRMPIYGKFLFYTVIGCALWNGAYIALGWTLGYNYTLIEKYAPIVEWAVLAGIAGGIAWFVWGRWRDHRRSQLADGPGGPEADPQPSTATSRPSGSRSFADGSRSRGSRRRGTRSRGS